MVEVVKEERGAESIARPRRHLREHKEKGKHGNGEKDASMRRRENERPHLEERGHHISPQSERKLTKLKLLTDPMTRTFSSPSGRS